MWQEITVAAIGVAVVIWVIRRIVKAVKHPDMCSGCSSDCSQCALKNQKEK